MNALQLVGFIGLLTLSFNYAKKNIESAPGKILLDLFYVAVFMDINLLFFKKAIAF